MHAFLQRCVFIARAAGRLSFLAVAIAIILFDALVKAAGAHELVRPASAPVLTWTQVPGAATRVAVAPDGSLWALGTTPAGAAKHVLHYSGGRWTALGGFATGITVAPNGVPYVVNALTGGIYALNGTSWTPVNNSSTPMDWVSFDTTISAYNSPAELYALARGTGDTSLYEFFKAHTAPLRLSGAASQLVMSQFGSSWIAIPNVGTISYDEDFFAIGATGKASIGLSNNGLYQTLPASASAIAPVPDGYFQLAYPPAPHGSQLSFFDYSTGTLATEPDSFVSIAAGPGTGGANVQLYGVDSANRIWTATVPPQPAPAYSTFYLPYPHPYLESRLVTGSDGALWYGCWSVEQGGGIAQICRLTTAGTGTEYTIPSGSIATGITPGPDGKLWFTEGSAGKVGTISTAGVVTEFPLPSASISPGAITAGPDGALWFTESSLGENILQKIGRITLAGKVDEYPLPGSRSGAAFSNDSSDDIVTGSDGALWFVESRRNTVDRITTTGVLTEFSIPTANSGPRDIAAGPDGALWFTEQGANNVGRMTTAGQFTEYSLPPGSATISSAPVDIAAGSDGALWFTNYTFLGRITTSGSLTSYQPPNAYYLDTIASGPDGALWLTDDTKAYAYRAALPNSNNGSVRLLRAR